MRKIIFQNLISLDGYFEGPNKEIDWHKVDSEFNDFAIAFLKTIFKGIRQRLKLKLLKTKSFNSGNVLLYGSSCHPWQW